MPKFQISPEVKAYFKYFGRGFYVVLAVVVIAGLIGLSFFYGNKHKVAPATTTSSQNVSQSSASTAPSSSSASSSPPNGSARAGSSASSNSSSSSSGADPTSTASQAPGQVVNTGPEDWAPLIGVVLGILGWHYFKSRQRLNVARQI